MNRCSIFLTYKININLLHEVSLKNGEDGIRTRGPAFDRSRL